MRVTPLPVFLLPFLFSTESFGYRAHSQHTVDVTDSSIHPRAGAGVPGSHADIPIVMSGALNPPSNWRGGNKHRPNDIEMGLLPHGGAAPSSSSPSKPDSSQPKENPSGSPTKRLRDLCSPTRGGVKRFTNMKGRLCALRYGSHAVWLGNDSGLCLVSSTDLLGVSGKGTCIVEGETRPPGINRSASFSNAERPENPADWRHNGVVDVSDSPHLHRCESGFIFSMVSYDECKILEGSVRWFRNTEVPTKGTCCHKDLELKVQIGDEPHVLQNLCKENKYVRAASVDGRGCSLKPGNFAWRPNAPKHPSVPDNNLCLSRPMDYARFGNTPGVCYCKLRVS